MTKRRLVALLIVFAIIDTALAAYGVSLLDLKMRETEIAAPLFGALIGLIGLVLTIAMCFERVRDFIHVDFIAHFWWAYMIVSILFLVLICMVASFEETQKPNLVPITAATMISILSWFTAARPLLFWNIRTALRHNVYE